MYYKGAAAPFFDYKIKKSYNILQIESIVK